MKKDFQSSSFPAIGVYCKTKKLTRMRPGLWVWDPKFSLSPPSPSSTSISSPSSTFSAFALSSYANSNSFIDIPHRKNFFYLFHFLRFFAFLTICFKYFFFASGSWIWSTISIINSSLALITFSERVRKMKNQGCLIGIEKVLDIILLFNHDLNCSDASENSISLFSF